VTSQVGVVADDLTGATDTAVQFARVGWPTLVALGRPVATGVAASDTDHGVVAVTTDARAADSPVAQKRTADAVRALVAGGVEQLYVKIDSTMRGSVGDQLAGALEAWSEKHPSAFVVLCPAYPAMGRTVTGGAVRVHGDPLEAGPAGQDPVTPVRTSVLSELIPGAVRVDSAPLTAVELAQRLRSAGHRAPVVTVDAGTDTDLGKIAEAVALVGPQAVPAGSAGLASALAGQWNARPAGARASLARAAQARSAPTLVLVTSLNRTARAQQQRLTEVLADRLTAIEPDLCDVMDDERCAVWRENQLQRSYDGYDVVLVSAPTQQSGSAGDTASRVARQLADFAADLHTTLDFAAVVVTGGDGARALVDRWKCTGIAIQDAVLEGIPQGVLVGGEVDGLPIITKAGGFGDHDALVAAVRRAQADLSPSNRTR
jgi:uncharacterized protein YgbK (DUF1537 family)